ncbi:class I adenylate-forming enzyme family protein [Baekduia soli]|nr:AMP-binding protein [Baekduia soli]
MTLDAIVRRGAGQQPGRVAVIDRLGSWTWRELEEQVTRSAAALRAAGVGPGDRVAAIDTTSAEYLALYYGAARAGAVLCPLNYLSAADELEYLLADLEPSLVLAGPEFAAATAAAAARAVPDTPVVGFGEPDAEWAGRRAGADPAAELEAPDPDGLHLILYTSGTTGRPKGACHTQRATYVDAFYGAIGYGARPEDTYLVHAPSFHCACWDHAKMYLSVDATLRILPRFEAGAALEAIERDGVTSLFGVPPVLRALLNHPRRPATDLSTLRTVIYGGALGELGVLDELREAVPGPLALYQTYGLTEGGPYVTAAAPALTAAKPGSIGRAVPGVEIALRDPDTGADVVDGAVGELCARSPSIMQGYWRNPEATAAAIRDGWLHTGDLARRDEDGDLHIVDRLKDMIRSGGENVFAAEVERVLMADPRVLEAAVIGLPDERWGERTVAIVVPNAGMAIDADDVRAWCRERLAAYKVPKQVELTAELPRTGLGKVAKNVLRATHGAA